MDTPNKAQQKLNTIQKLENLSKVDIFARVGPQELLLLANQCIQADFEINDVIFREGERARDMFALVQGKIELSRANGHRTAVTPGESFGTLSVLSDAAHLYRENAGTMSVSED